MAWRFWNEVAETCRPACGIAGRRDKTAIQGKTVRDPHHGFGNGRGGRGGGPPGEESLHTVDLWDRSTVEFQYDFLWRKNKINPTLRSTKVFNIFR